MSFADQLTLARAAAVPFVILLFTLNFDGHAYWATALFIVAMATDQVDGWLARRQGRTSELGSLLDPMADKLLTLSTLIVLVGEGALRGWMVALIVVRELLVAGLRMAALERGVVIDVVLGNDIVDNVVKLVAQIPVLVAVAAFSAYIASRSAPR